MTNSLVVPVKSDGSPVGPYQIQQIHFLSRYRSHAVGGYYSVCLSASDFLLPVSRICFASRACCLPPPVPSLPIPILLFLYMDSNSWPVKRLWNLLVWWDLSSVLKSALHVDVRIWNSSVKRWDIFSKGYFFAMIVRNVWCRHEFNCCQHLQRLW